MPESKSNPPASDTENWRAVRGGLRLLAWTWALLTVVSSAVQIYSTEVFVTARAMPEAARGAYVNVAFVNLAYQVSYLALALILALGCLRVSRAPERSGAMGSALGAAVGFGFVAILEVILVYTDPFGAKVESSQIRSFWVMVAVSRGAAVLALAVTALRLARVGEVERSAAWKGGLIALVLLDTAPTVLRALSSEQSNFQADNPWLYRAVSLGIQLALAVLLIEALLRARRGLVTDAGENVDEDDDDAGEDDADGEESEADEDDADEEEGDGDGEEADTASRDEADADEDDADEAAADEDDADEDDADRRDEADADEDDADEDDADEAAADEDDADEDDADRRDEADVALQADPVRGKRKSLGKRAAAADETDADETEADEVDADETEADEADSTPPSRSVSPSSVAKRKLLTAALTLGAVSVLPLWDAVASGWFGPLPPADPQPAWLVLGLPALGVFAAIAIARILDRSPYAARGVFALAVSCGLIYAGSSAYESALARSHEVDAWPVCETWLGPDGEPVEIHPSPHPPTHDGPHLDNGQPCTQAVELRHKHRAEHPRGDLRDGIVQIWLRFRDERGRFFGGTLWVLLSAGVAGWFVFREARRHERTVS